jgi:hypothetical protein
MPEDNLDDNQPDEPQEPQVTRTRSGRTIQQPRRYVEDIVQDPHRGRTRILSTSGRNGMQGLGSVELLVMKYKQAMNSKDKKLWIKAVNQGHDRMEKYKVFNTVKKTTHCWEAKRDVICRSKLSMSLLY